MPAAVRDEASDACFLAASYGLTPDPWQRLILAGWLGVREDGRWSSPRTGLAVPRQNGKNSVLEVRELFGMIELAERILHTAHEVKTARKAFARLLEFFDNEKQYPELRRLVREVRRTNGQEAIVLHNGGSVEFVARSKGSGRGFSVDVIVMDEAQELSEDALAALLPTVSASDNPQTILTGTPPGPSAIGEVFTRTRNAGVRGDDPRLCWMEWGCDPDALDLDDQAQWLAANPAAPARLRLETMADERSSMDDETFARERLGVWRAGGSAAAIPPATWQALTDPSAVPVDPVAFGVEVSPDASWTSIGIAARRADGTPYVEVVESQRGTGWVVDRLVELQSKWRPLAIAVNPGGPAGALLTGLAERGVEPMLLSARELGQSCGEFFVAATETGLVHRGQPLLAVAVGAARKRKTGDAWVWQPANAKTDIAPLWAVTLALHAFLSLSHVKGRSGKASFF